MKVIMIENKIISLENVITAEFRTFGTGAKSNPYHYDILIKYSNGAEAFTEYFDNKVEAERYFNQIFTILSGEE